MNTLLVHLWILTNSLYITTQPRIWALPKVLFKIITSPHYKLLLLLLLQFLGINNPNKALLVYPNPTLFVSVFTSVSSSPPFNPVTLVLSSMDIDRPS